ncbi:hypothetical protein K438DRAFT_1805155 [Mycena galopus ATCC 62051]|nr:hypothetical protein K438DRAFT_1805155 [Mycena galopus ATCC 62051]
MSQPKVAAKSEKGGRNVKDASNSSTFERLFDWVKGLVSLVQIWAFSNFLGARNALVVLFSVLFGGEDINPADKREAVLYLLHWPIETLWVNYFWCTVFLLTLISGPFGRNTVAKFSAADAVTEGTKVVDRAAFHVKTALAKWGQV